MYSNNNPILIGKNGQTLEALQNIVKNVVSNNVGIYPVVMLDVENYKEKQEKRIERLAKDTAREVLRTKVEARLENMNSYERRIVHNILTDFKGIYTTSEGEEPNRYVVIKIKEDK
jgi:spoIIIJ-associated protein